MRPSSWIIALPFVCLAARAGEPVWTHQVEKPPTERGSLVLRLASGHDEVVPGAADRVRASVGVGSLTFRTSRQG